MAEEQKFNAGEYEKLTRAEQVLKDILEKQLNVRFKSNAEFKQLVNTTEIYLKQLNQIEISLLGVIG